MAHLSEEDLVLLYYNEPGVSSDSREHLAECGECWAASEALADTLRFCDELPAPDPGPEFGRAAWARLAPQLQQTRSRGWFTAGLRPRVWVGLVAVAALVVAAFVLGRSTVLPNVTVTAGLSRRARERILAISVADHLGRAEQLFTEVANTSEGDAPQVAALRDRAQDLVQEGRLIRQWSSEEHATAAPLLDDVDRFVMELANAPDHIGPGELRSWQSRLDSESLLFKVRIIQSNLLTSGQRL